ncbi:LOW QUALITY PROTEIN: hypothetical protein V1478_005965 [Vespula squamosa]|uniref:Uncharacterized protein n=1 Tax=Vespula squamosa TaxID=30214 RepID=A0ABD2B8W5_VESSQ
MSRSRRMSFEGVRIARRYTVGVREESHGLGNCTRRQSPGEVAAALLQARASLWSLAYPVWGWWLSEEGVSRWRAALFSRPQSEESSCGIGESRGCIGETEKENRGLSGAEASTTSKQALGFFLDSKPREA